jgi:metal-responsive CopG/Arc/MetJ family transcriptional regulator
MAETKQQISVWLPGRLVRWLRVTAAERGTSRSRIVEELIEAEQQDDSAS